MNHLSGFDVAIVGGGIAGLAAAVYAARSGRAVVVFEQGAHAGGRATTRVTGGYHFNQGPHALYLGGEGRRILQDLGIRYSGTRASYEGAWFLRDGQQFPWPRDGEGWLATELLSPEGRQEILAVLGAMEQLATEGSCSLSLREWLDATIRDAQARSVIEGIARLSTYCADSRAQSAHAALEQTATGAKGVEYLDGGWQTLVDLLGEAAQAAGVRIHTRSQVTGIRCDGGAATIELADESRVAVRSVISTVGPASAARLVNGGTVISLRGAAERAVPIYAACLDIALRRLPRPEHQFAIDVDRPWYYSVHTRSARLAPEGGAVIHLAKYRALGENLSAAETQGELEGVMDWLQPGWRVEVVQKRFLPRMLVTNAMVTTAQGGVSGRPASAVPEIPNLFLAGDWIGPRGMLVDASFASARAAAGLATACLRGSEAQGDTARIPMTAAGN